MTAPAIDLARIIVALACVAAAVSDVRRFRVPNALTLPLLLAGLAVRGAAGLQDLGTGGLGVAAAFLVLIGFHAIGAMGAGDVKLGMAAGAWLGPDAVLRVLLVAALAGGAYVLALRAATGGIAGLFSTLWLALSDPLSLLPSNPGGDLLRRRLASADRRRHLVPFGAMLAIGVMVVAASDGPQARPAADRSRPPHPAFAARSVPSESLGPQANGRQP